MPYSMKRSFNILYICTYLQGKIHFSRVSATFVSSFYSQKSCKEFSVILLGFEEIVNKDKFKLTYYVVPHFPS